MPTPCRRSGGEWGRPYASLCLCSFPSSVRLSSIQIHRIAHMHMPLLFVCHSSNICSSAQSVESIQLCIAKPCPSHSADVLRCSVSTVFSLYKAP